MPHSAPIRSRRVPRQRGITRALVLGCCLGLFVPQVFAQTARVSGSVRSAAAGQPLAFVNIALFQGEKVAAGVVSTSDGLFVIPRIEPGRYTLKASYIGFETYTDTLVLEAGEVRTLNIRMRSAEQSLGEVVVESERISGGAHITAGKQTITPADIELIPMPDVSGDLASYLTALPGVVTTGDRGGQLFIRGGEPTQNLILMDGIPLLQPFHLVGFYSAFPADIINHTDLYAGGFGSQFGDRLSSVIDVSTRNGNSRQFAGAVAASPFLASARLDAPLMRDHISLLASARQSLIGRTDRVIVGRELPFVFGDFFAKLHVQPNTRHQVSVTALHTYDRGTVGETAGGTNSDEVRWQNQGVGVRYLMLPTAFPAIGDVHFSVSRLLSELGPSRDPARTSDVRDYHLALEGTFPGQRASFQAGWKMDVIQFKNDLGGAFQNFQSTTSWLTNVAMYLEPEIELGSFRIHPGMRLQYYSARDAPILEPRLRLVWEHGIHQISGAAGLYHQEFVGLVDRRDAASVFTAWTTFPKDTDRKADDFLAGRLPQAVHFIGGYRITPSKSVEFSIEGFYKKLSSLLVPEWTAYPRFTTRLQPARGRSFGFDTRLEVRRDPFYAFVSYGLSSTRYQAEQAALKLWYGVEHLDYRPPHDRRHQINAILSTSIRKFDVNVHWAFGSGFPFSRVLGFDGFILMNGLKDVTEDEGTHRVIYERPFNAVLPAYHRLDVSVERTFPVGAADLTVQATAINLYDRRNIFYLDTFTLQRSDQLPFVPSLGIKVSFE